MPSTSFVPYRRFNEAACNTGGTRPDAARAVRHQQGASMRPPAIQAERDIEETEQNLAEALQ